jgi:tetratricopeptide (TPR) repeat protein
LNWKMLITWLPRLFGGVIVLLGISGLYVVFAAKAQTPRPAATQSSAEKPEDSTARSAELTEREAKATATEARAKEAETELKESADELKNRVDELKWILALIVTAAGLFTLAQGVAAGFSAQSFTKLGDDIVARLKTLETDVRSRFDGMTNEVQARYPIFSDMEERRGQALADLSAMLKKSSPLNNADEGFDSRRHFYGAMPLAQRQGILSVERFISYDIAGQNESAEESGRQLRRLAQFFWAKFLHEHSRGFGQIGDMERAEYLLDVAKRRIGVQFYLLNDLGNIRLDSFKARVDVRLTSTDAKERRLAEADRARALELALEAFDDSIKAQPEQLRAYYNRAVIEAGYRSDFAAAIKTLEVGLTYPNWETSPVPGLTCNAHFNLGCCYARVAERAQNSAAWAQKCVEQMTEAAAIGQIDPNDVNREYGMTIEAGQDGLPLSNTVRTGDLYVLATSGDQATRDALAKLKQKLSAKHVKA